MKFALVGDHPDGLDIARALAASGRHEVHAYTGPAPGAEALTRDGIVPRRAVDLEDVLADPAVEAVIVATSIASRPATLRRAIQSERHVLCVHPADGKPDLAFEASMMQAETRFVLLPLLPEAFHPGVARFASLARGVEQGVLEMRRDSRDDIWFELTGDDPLPGLPGWDVLRRIGGEITEVFALGSGDEQTNARPTLVSGRFAGGGLFQAVLQPEQPDSFWRLAVVGARPLALVFPEGWPGPATLTYEDDTGAMRTESWPALPPWNPVIDAFDKAVSQSATRRRSPRPGEAPAETIDHSWTSVAPSLSDSSIQSAETMVGITSRMFGPTLGWTDETRALELDDAVRRSLTYHRAYTLDLQQVNEEANFKGSMTLVGCGLMWAILVLLPLMAFVPWLGYVVVGAVAAFLAVQVLRPKAKKNP